MELSPYPVAEPEKMKSSKELNLHKEMDCGTAAEISRHTQWKGGGEGEGEGRAQIAFCRLQTKAFLRGEGRAGLPENPSLAMVATMDIG